MMPAPPYEPRGAHFHARLLAAMMPENVAKSIGNAEFNDRIVEAARLSRQANDPALSPALRQAAKIRAQAVMCAQPRQVTQRQQAGLIAKAAAAPPAQAEAIRRRADRLLEEEQPIAPSRAATVRKADAEPVPVFDRNGNLVGICDPDDITPVSATRQDNAAAVAKASGRVGSTTSSSGRSWHAEAASASPAAGLRSRRRRHGSPRSLHPCGRPRQTTGCASATATA